MFEDGIGFRLHESENIAICRHCVDYVPPQFEYGEECFQVEYHRATHLRAFLDDDLLTPVGEDVEEEESITEVEHFTLFVLDFVVEDPG